MKILAACALLLVLSPTVAAAGSKGLSPQVVSQLRGKPVVYEQRTPIDFFYDPYRPVVLYGSMEVEAQQWWKFAPSADPARAMSKALIADLSTRFGMVAEPEPLNVDNLTKDAVAALERRPGYVLRVTTQFWSLRFVQMDIEHFKIDYVGRMELFDGATGRRVAVATCVYNGPKAGAPTFDQAVARHGARISRMLDVTAADCLGRFRTKLFGEGGSPIAP